jgi:hypothetical protein
MTTIAWDGSTLAADSQSTSGDVICSLKEKKIYQPSESGTWTVNGETVWAIGCSGDCGAEEELQAIMETGLNYATQFLPTFSFTALAIVGKERAFIISKDKGEDRASISLQLDPYAIGSGSMIARAAMRCGKSAIEAVHVAIEMDVYSGGMVDYIKQD